MKLELIATATFGLEAVVKREVENLGYKIIKTEDGKVTYVGDERAIVRSNLWLRSADRVLLRVAEFEAADFESLYQQIKAIAWEEIIPPDGKFIVTGVSVKSRLHNVPACQRTVKKAVAERLGEFYGTETLPETGAAYTIKVTLLKDRATITIDTSGAGLHKRGYRVKDVDAPIKETLAAALIQLSFWHENRVLVDPCCGSGTIPIEAAMIGKNIAPGLNRSFACEGWSFIPAELWREERKLAREAINFEQQLNISGFDIDSRAVAAAKENAIEAGVDDCVLFGRNDVARLKPTGDNGIIITNPPYGERIGEKKQIDGVYAALKRFISENPDWSIFMVTTDKSAEDKVAGRPADRRRKLYNGRLEVCYYQFHGVKKQAEK